MPSLVIQTTLNGGRRRCDAKCHEATGHKCTCICGGIFHGKPYQTSNDLMNFDLAKRIAKRNPGTHLWFPKMQMSLFPPGRMKSDNG